LFMRGAFTAADALAAAVTLAAYATGLIPFMLMRSFTAPFLARGDTATPVKAALAAAAVNILLKIVLTGPLAQVGLALATSAGAWLNLLLLWIAARAFGFRPPEATLERAMRLILCGIVLGAALWGGERLIGPWLAGVRFRDELLLLILLAAGGALYAALVIGLMGRPWLRDLLRDGRAPAVPADLPAAD
jgi:putative peptidoglycan lipid II flippase